jgi:arylformamidase
MPPTVVAVGGGETDEFRRQSRIYTDACRDAGFDVSYLEVGNHDHVNVAGEYRNKLSPLTAALFSQMGL